MPFSRSDSSSAPPPSNGARARAVLWDLDGTLADSGAFHWRSWQSALQAEAVDVTEADFIAAFGLRSDETLIRWLGADAEPDRIRRISAEKEVCYRALLDAEGLEPLPGAADWVQQLHAAGWLQAIASSAPRLNVEAARRALRFTNVINAVVSAEDVRIGKPDPEVFLVAAARLNVPVERCVVVEDAGAGIEAARRAGMHTIGVGAGSVGAADVVVRSLTDLPPDIFQRLIDTT